MSPEWTTLTEGPSLASPGFTDFSQIDILEVRYESVDVGAEQSPGSSNW